MEALSAAKRSVIYNYTIVDRHNNDVICLQETCIDSDVSSRFKINGFDLISYRLNDKHGRALYVKSNMTDVSEQFSTTHCDVVKVGNYSTANVYKPPSEGWDVPNLLRPLPHPAIYVGDFNSHHPDWGYGSADTGGEQLIDWASCNDPTLVHDPKQKGTFRSAHWQ